jgi:peptide-methionine (S)-S-oxide reductase
VNKGIHMFKSSIIAILAVLVSCWCQPASAQQLEKKGKPPMNAPQHVEKATFGSGCFWCTEAVFLRLRGVQSVVSGYAGGHVQDPTYEQVCSGATGHAECIQITFDPQLVSYVELLKVFFKTHDPTTLNRQGNDIGPQYRSVIFYHNDAQKKAAEEAKAALDAAGAFPRKIVTQIVPYTNFFAAEDYHQDYFARNPRQPYCAAIVQPKVEKFEQVFRDKLKDAKTSAGR